MTRSHKKIALIGAAILGAGYVLKKLGVLSFYSGPVPGSDGPIVDDPEDFDGDAPEGEDDEESDS